MAAGFARLGKAFLQGRRVLEDAGVGCVVFAHKTTEGWEALKGIVRLIPVRGRAASSG